MFLKPNKIRIKIFIRLSSQTNKKWWVILVKIIQQNYFFGNFGGRLAWPLASRVKVQV